MTLPSGYLFTEEETALKEISFGAGLCIDLGTCHGRSAVVLAEGADKVITVDVFEEFSLIKNVGSREHYAKLFQDAPHYFDNVKRDLAAYPNITVLMGATHSVAGGVADKSVDVLFIDADHSYIGVKKDFEAWFPKVKIGGYIALHDTYSENWDVGAYVENEVVRRDDLELIKKVRTMAVFLKVI